MEVYHFINLVVLAAVFIVVIILPVWAWLTDSEYRRRLHRAYMTTTREWHPLLPLPAQVHLYRGPYRTIRGVSAHQKKMAAKRKTTLPRKSGRK